MATESDLSAVRYLTYPEAVTLHIMLMRRLGETHFGVFERSLVESALARPRHAATLEGADIIRQAATLCFGLIKNHPWLGATSARRPSWLIVSCISMAWTCARQSTKRSRWCLPWKRTDGTLMPLQRGIANGHFPCHHQRAQGKRRRSHGNQEPRLVVADPRDKTTNRGESRENPALCVRTTPDS